jgi:hypothetical protein
MATHTYVKFQWTFKDFFLGGASLRLNAIWHPKEQPQDPEAPGWPFSRFRRVAASCTRMNATGRSASSTSWKA